MELTIFCYICLLSLIYSVLKCALANTLAHISVTLQPYKCIVAQEWKTRAVNFGSRVVGL